MSQPTKTIQILAHARTADGLAFQLRKDPPGVLDVPELDNILLSIHLGAPAKMACRRDGRRFIGTAVHGDIDIIPANTASRWEMFDDNDTALLLSLPQTLIAAIARESGADPAKIEIRNRFQIRDSQLETLSWAVKKELELGCPSGRLYLDGLGLAIASRVITQHSSLTKSARVAEGLTDRRLKQVLSFIEENLSEELSLEQIAAVARVSASHLKSVFRKAMGTSVHQYVIQRRVELAKSMLQQDDHSMTEIALAAGFAHQSHLARHMRRLLGASPRDVKRILRENAATN